MDQCLAPAPRGGNAPRPAVTGRRYNRGGHDILRITIGIGVVLGLLLSATGCLHRHKIGPAARATPPPAPTTPIPPTPAIPATPRTPTTPPSPRPTPVPAPIIQDEEGIASWYGHHYHGRHTANGEIYNMYGISAAHRTLPFGTVVCVHDLENGRDVTVRINDRGPFIEGRIIDLSFSAAQAMGMSGIAPVRLEIVGRSASSEPGIFAVQVGAFRDRRNADRMKSLIETRHWPVVILGFDRGDGTFYRVRVGSESSEDAARELAQQLRRENPAMETFVVRMN